MALTRCTGKRKDKKYCKIKQGRCTHFDADIYDGTFS